MTLQRIDAPSTGLEVRRSASTATLPAYTPAEESTGTRQSSPDYTNAAQEKEQLQATINGRGLPEASPELDADAEAEGEAVMPSRKGPGHASSSTLARGLQVPTCNSLVSSGFPYPDALAQHQVSAADWARFTSEITKAAKLKPGDWALSLGGGTGTFLASGLVIGWLGIIPAVIVGRRIHQKLEHRNLTSARDTGTLEAQLLRWNQDFFAPRGLLIRLDLPGDATDFADMDIHSRRGRHCPHGNKRGRSFTCVPCSNDVAAGVAPQVEHESAPSTGEKGASKYASRSQRKASRQAWWQDRKNHRVMARGRIVILPTSGDQGPVRGQTTESTAAAAKDVSNEKQEVGQISVHSVSNNL